MSREFPTFTATVDDGASVPVLIFAGELDLSVADAAWEQVRSVAESSPDGLVIDLHGLTFMDSRGLNVLVLVLRTLGDAPLTLRRTPDRIRHLLDVSGLTERVRFR